MSDIRRVGKYVDRELRPNLLRVLDSVSYFLNRRNSNEDVHQQQMQEHPPPPILERPVELNPRQPTNSSTPSPIPDETPVNNSHKETANLNSPEDPPGHAKVISSRPLSVQELIAHGPTPYYRFKLHEFDIAVETGLGTGGQAHVYLRKHRNFGILAVKIFFTNSPAELKEREMKNILKLQGHPGVVRLYGFFYNEDETEITGYVMEHVALSMADVIFSKSDSGKRIYKYSTAQAVKWIIEIAACMSYSHELGILHRDLKPHNILIVWDKKGKPIRICDLGCSKDIDLSNGKTTTGVGTPLYRPPEWILSRQTQEQSEMHKEGDVYSLGNTFWELLYRQTEPSLGRNQAEICHNLQMGMRPKIDSSCPQELASVIRRCWANDVRKRPTMMELKEELETLLAQNDEWKEMMVTGTEEMGLEQCEF